MNQRFTDEQLNEQTEDEKEKLCDWWNPEESDWVLGGRFGPNTICDVKNKTSEITICMECVDYSTRITICLYFLSDSVLILSRNIILV